MSEAGPSILVAGIGNMFLGDDGFGVEVVRRLRERPLPMGVKVTEFGDQVAPESVTGAVMRLNEFTVGLVMAQISSAAAISPPTNWYPVFDRPSSFFSSSKAFFSPCQSDTWAWQPEPVRLANGFGMKVARSPCFSAIDFTMYLKKAWRSAVTSMSS